METNDGDRQAASCQALSPCSDSHSRLCALRGFGVEKSRTQAGIAKCLSQEDFSEPRLLRLHRRSVCVLVAQSCRTQAGIAKYLSQQDFSEPRLLHLHRRSVCVLVAQSCPVLGNTIGCSPTGSPLIFSEQFLRASEMLPPGPHSSFCPQ